MEIKKTIRKQINILQTIVALFTFTLAPNVAFAQQGPYEVRCLDAETPEGFVIVDFILRAEECPPTLPEDADYHNAKLWEQYTNKPYGYVMTVCADSPIPSDWQEVPNSHRFSDGPCADGWPIRAGYVKQIANIPPAIFIDNMEPGEMLTSGESRSSTNGNYTFVYQDDGNLVLYRNRDRLPLWASNTSGTIPGVCIMQTDGNLVIYDPNGNPIWSSNTWQYPGSRLVVQIDGNVVIYTPDNTPVWSTNTHHW